MELHGMSLFCIDGNGVRFKVDVSRPQETWPITLRLSPTKELYPKIDIYCDEVSFVAFKNFVLYEFEKYMKLRTTTEWVVPYSFTGTPISVPIPSFKPIYVDTFAINGPTDEGEDD